MRRALLPVVALLALLILGDKLRSRNASPVATSPPGPVSAAPAAPAPQAAPVPAPPTVDTSSQQSATPTVDLYARLASRRLLIRQGAGTYVDSLLATSDSIIRRWPDRGRSPLRVLIVTPANLPGFKPGYVNHIQAALDRWTAASGLTFKVVDDTSDAPAHIVVAWTAAFDNDKVGETELQWSRSGEIAHAEVRLALRTRDGLQLSEQALRAVATHEIGHAIGLPHSADSADVMYPESRSENLSDRDVRTVGLLYQLPPGTVKAP